MYEKELQNLGLGGKEAKVYLAALELGPDTAQNIAKRAGINRPTTYVQINSLKDKGLMSEFTKGKKTLYLVEPPDRLQGLLSRWKKEMELKELEIARILPKLSEMFAGAGEMPKVRFFEGKEGAAAMHADFLKMSGKLIQVVANLDKLFEVFPKHEDKFTSLRIKRGISSQVLYTRQNGPLPSANDSKKMRTAKYVPYDRFPVTADITIYDNKVAIATYKTEPVGVIIESKEVAETLRGMFYLIWRGLPDATDSD